MPPSTLLTPWCDKIAKDSNNRMKCQIYPAMQLGGAPPQLIQQAMDGVADIVWTLPGYTAGRFPMMEVFELPFMSQSAEATSQAAWDYYTQYGYKEFPGIKALAVNVHDNGYVHTVAKQVKVMADFKGLKMRAPTRQTNKLLGALGATPVAMPLPALGDALSKGVVDGYMLPWEVIPSIKAHEFTKFESETDPKVARALHRGVHPRDEPGEVRQPPGGPEAGDRRELGRGAVEDDGHDVGRIGAARAQARRRSRQYVLRDSGVRARELAEGHGQPARRMGQGRQRQGPGRQDAAAGREGPDQEVRNPK